MSMLPDHTEFTTRVALLEAALDEEWGPHSEEPYFVNPAAGFILAIPLGLSFWAILWFSLQLWGLG